VTSREHVRNVPASEFVIVVAPFVLGAALVVGWPRVRRTPIWKLALYPLALTPIIAAAEWSAAASASGRLLWMEVFWAVYFVIAWRLAWAVWTRTVGRIGEKRRRWARLVRRRPETTRREQRVASLCRLIAPARVLCTLLVFVPLVAGSLIHRFKIGNAPAVERVPELPVEEVRFRTGDGLSLSGWFAAEPGSDATVVICHGLGANKSNFADFLRLFCGQGYSALIFDFRGHGDSDGHTSTFGLLESRDVTAAVTWLKRERPAQAVHVYGIGSSMGAMALVRSAADDTRIEAVVLDSLFAGVPMMADTHVGRLPVVGPLLGHLIIASMSLHAGRSLWALDARPAIAAISPRPVLLIQGDDDVLIPPESLDVLYAAAAQPKARWLAPGPHSNIMSTDFHEYQRRVLAFLDLANAHAPR